MLNWLESNNWKVLCYDFPQSGAGILIHPNISKNSSKSKDGIIPDILAQRNGVTLFIENKDRFFYPDFVKLKKIKNEGGYTKGISELIYPSNLLNIYYGIGVYNYKKNVIKGLDNISGLDFLLSVNDSGSVNVDYDPCNVFN